MRHAVCVAIPSRNEPLLVRTVLQFLKSAKYPDDVEIGVVLDGWDVNPVNKKMPQATADIHRTTIDQIKALASSDPRIVIHELPEHKGVRHALNRVAATTTCKYIIKLDAHCELSQNWDDELIKSYEDSGLETLVVPRICSLDPDTFERGTRFFDWQYIDSDIHQRHWPEFGKRPEAQKNICEIMSNLGASWFTSVQYWWQLNGHDESLYTWGESAPETSLKCWLSGGRQILNKNVFFAHVFRNKFPYNINGHGVLANKRRTKEYWLNNEYPMQIHPIEWLVRKFGPVPTWEGVK